MTFQIPVATGIWKVMGSALVKCSENSFSEYFDLRMLLHYLHFIQVTNWFINNWKLEKKHEKFSLNSLDPDQKNGVKSNNQPQMSPFEPTEKIFTVTRL